MPTNTRPVTTRPAVSRPDEVRAKLRIDEDDLDQCLVDQPEYFFKAAEAAVALNSEHDTLKLELKELVAQLDQDIRRKAIEDEEKLSEAAISNRITILPRVKELQRKILDTKKRYDNADALRESYIQRSHALRELNSSAQARLYNLGVERGAGTARGRIGDRNREATETVRRERYRPSSASEE